MSGEAPETGGGQPLTDPPAAVQVPNAPLRVFISYASRDVAIANGIAETLERHGVACWIAPRDVKAGAVYADAIVRAISCAQVVVVVLSEKSVTSSHVGKEIERASSKRRPIIALRIDEAPLSPALEYFLGESQWVDARAGDMDAALAKLIAAIRDRPLDAPAITPPVTSATSAIKGPAATRKLRRNRLVLAAVFAAVMVALAWLLTDKFWISKRVSHEKPAAAASPVASAGVPASSAISEKSIAVLPFVDMSEKRDQEYFADGMAEEIINLLSNVPDLRVPARTSSFYFKGKSTKLPDIARELGVAHVLEGSIRRSGSQIRVTAQLVRADTGYHLWSQTYDRDLRDVFKVQDEIANAVVQALQITLMGGPLTRQRGGTRNLEAYQLYLRGHSTFPQSTKPALLAAQEYLDQAIKLDPAFALAQIDLALDTLVMTDSSILSPKDGYERARELAQHALQVSPDLAGAHFVLQYVHRTYDWDWTAAEAEGRQGLALDPTNTVGLLHTGMTSGTLGYWDDAERQLRSALVRDPLYGYVHLNLGITLYRAGRFADAEASFRRLLEISPDFSWAHQYLGKTLLAEGKTEAALAMVQQEDTEEFRLDTLPIVLQAAGRKAAADKALNALVTKFADTSAYSVAMCYAYRGDHDLALHWLERAYTQKDPALVEIVGEHLFKNLANDPRYQAFLRKMKLPESQSARR